MKISRVSVRNFRSVKKVDIHLDSFSIFVGQNNHGKTNLFEAIEWFYNAKSSSEDLFFEKNTTVPIEVELEYVDVVEDDIEKLSADATKTKIRNLLVEQIARQQPLQAQPMTPCIKLNVGTTRAIRH